MSNQLVATTSSTLSIGTQIPPVALTFPVAADPTEPRQVATQAPASPSPTPLGGIQADEHWTAVTMYVAGMYLPNEG